MKRFTDLDGDVTYPKIDMTPTMVAGYVKDHAYNGRDHDLAQGWLVAIDAARRGVDVEQALQEFLDSDFLVGNNNGVPGWHVKPLVRAGG